MYASLITEQRNPINLRDERSMAGIPANFCVKNIGKIGILCQKIGAL